MTAAGDVMAAVRNYFPREELKDTWTIRNGALSPARELLAGDWVAVTGSRRSDGVYCLGTGLTLEGSTDESFTGSVWLLAPPPAFLSLCEEIAAWRSTHERTALKSESLGEYSREQAVDAFGTPAGWQQVFAADLVPWRRMVAGVRFG